LTSATVGNVTASKTHSIGENDMTRDSEDGTGEPGRGDSDDVLGSEDERTTTVIDDDEGESPDHDPDVVL
jgi:hypothetical protein